MLIGKSLHSEYLRGTPICLNIHHLPSKIQPNGNLTLTLTPTVRRSGKLGCTRSLFQLKSVRSICFVREIVDVRVPYHHTRITPH